MENGGSTLLYKMLEDMLALANVVWWLGVIVWCVRKRKRSKARHSTVQHDKARHRAAGHDNSRYHTALRCACEVAKLSGAGVHF